MSLGTSNRDGGKTSESGHLRALGKIVSGDIITGLNAVQRAAGVNMSVDVQVGDAFLRRSDGTYAHPVFNDAVYNQVISAADGSNPRRDIVVIYLDYGQTPSTAVSNNTNGVVKIKVVNGTPAGSPVDPNGAAIQASVGAGNPYSILARVRVPAGQTSITNSLIDDLRVMVAPVRNGGWSTTDPASLSFTSYSSTTKIGVIATTVDLRATVQVGHRFAVWQSTGGWKYGIIHAITASAITVFFGTDYTLNNELMFLGKTSGIKSPMGFNANPLKWTLEALLTSDYASPSATQNVWYNADGHALPLGVGDWAVEGQVMIGAARGAAGRTDVMGGLSTSASSPSSDKLIKGIAGGNAGVFLASAVTVSDAISLPSGGSLYFITRTTASGVSQLFNFGTIAVLSGPRVIRARSAYL